jgi:hypothetical protein
MKTTIGTAIISNGVISRIGLKLTWNDEDKNIFIYQTPPLFDSLGVVMVQQPYSSDSDPRQNYLAETSTELGFSVLSYGGIDDARVYIQHPEENEVIETIDSLTNEFRNIKLPENIVRQLEKEPFSFDLYEPLDSWSRRFGEDFSKFLPEIEPKS